MASSVKVFIGGKEYSLAGENPEMIKQTASIVNKQVEQIVSTTGDLPDKSLSFMLAALNIAESNISSSNHISNSTEYLMKELKKMEQELFSAINS